MTTQKEEHLNYNWFIALVFVHSKFCDRIYIPIDRRNS